MILKTLTSLLSVRTAYAHCDIPCGIYDPHMAQVAAHTVVRMTQLILDTKGTDSKSIHNVSRMTHVKEEHAGRIEEELETLRNDYFKDEHFKEYPDLEELIKDTIDFASKARQNIDMDVALKALAGTQAIAEIFYKTKGVTPVRVKSVYPTLGEIVTYK